MLSYRNGRTETVVSKRSMLGREQTASASIRVKRRIIKLAGVAGAIWPILFGGVLVMLSVLAYDFMLGIGWQPVADPAGAWPSGLALGPFGAAQIANFVISGFLLCLFAVGLHLEIATRHTSTCLAPTLFFVAGVAVTLMGFRTDPIERVGPRSLHGLIHDSAFVVFVLAFLAALFFLWWGLRWDARWRDTRVTPWLRGYWPCSCYCCQAWPTTCSSSCFSPGSRSQRSGCGDYPSRGRSRHCLIRTRETWSWRVWPAAGISSTPPGFAGPRKVGLFVEGTDRRPDVPVPRRYWGTVGLVNTTLLGDAAIVPASPLTVMFE